MYAQLYNDMFFINFNCRTFSLVDIENYFACEIITGQIGFKCNYV